MVESIFSLIVTIQTGLCKEHIEQQSRDNM